MALGDLVVRPKIAKAPLALPAGSQTQNEQQARAQAEAAGWSTAGYKPLPRTQPVVPFGPGVPLGPAAIDPLEGFVRPRPRRNEYEIAWNLPGSGNPTVPWRVLRDVSTRVEVIRRCIEVRKSQLLSLDWDITLRDTAIERIMVEQNITQPGRASAMARQKFAEEMTRVRDFWASPDQTNGLSFADWLGLVLEDMFVLDAVSIYPQMTLGRDLQALVVLDGSTIKPLLDHAGMTPQPPEPAYQQILYGFPRGEFVASSKDVSQEFAADRLIYAPRHRRSYTPYGYSNVEQALPLADLWLKREEWLRAEYSYGTTPSTFMESSIGIDDLTPEQMRQYEAVLNDQLSGSPEERKRIKLLVEGMKAVPMEEHAEKFKPDYDEYLIKLLCACFDVMPTEIGFAPRGGLGGKGHQEGEESATYRKAIRPTVVWLQNLLSRISEQYLGMSPDLAFSFLGYEIEDQFQLEKTVDSAVRGARMTPNEARAAKGQPLFEFAEADELVMVTGAGIQFLNGARALQAQALNPGTSSGENGNQARPIDSTPRPPQASQGDAPPSAARPAPSGGPSPAGGQKAAQVAELAAFRTFAEKRIKSGRPWRDFVFKHVEPERSDLLNMAGDRGDLDGIRAQLGKARAPRRGWAADRHRARIVNTHKSAVRDATRALFPSARDLADVWRLSLGKGAKPEVRASARSILTVHTGSPHDLAAAFGPAIDDSYSAGAEVAADALGIDPQDVDTSDLVTPDDILNRSDTAALAVVAALTTRLANTMGTGDPSDLEQRLSDVLDDPSIADQQLDYESQIGIVNGAMDEYGRRGVQGMEFEPDDTACDLCDSQSGPLDPGDDRPPLHPGCGCAVLPAQN